MLVIQTKRLKLVALSHQQLLLCQQNRAALEQSLGLNISAMQIAYPFRQEMQEAIQNFCLPNTLAYPDLYPWYTNWEIVLKDINTSVGGIGFGGYPDDNGATSIGYFIDQQHSGKGYATEAVAAFIEWGYSYSVLKTINADTNRDNLASQKVLLKMGFKQTHREQDTLYYKHYKTYLNMI